MAYPAQMTQHNTVMEQGVADCVKQDRDDISPTAALQAHLKQAVTGRSERSCSAASTWADATDCIRALHMPLSKPPNAKYVSSWGFLLRVLPLLESPDASN